MTQSFSSLSNQAIEEWDTLHISPWIRVSTGLMGEASGSDAILEVLKAEVKELGVEVYDKAVKDLGVSKERNDITTL